MELMGITNPTVVDYAFMGSVLHLIADWLFQNKWMANNKSSLSHPAAWVHSFIHLVVSWVVFPFYFALLISVIHILIDDRYPLRLYRRFLPATSYGAMGLIVEVWSDQVLHIAVIVIVSMILVLG